MTKDMKKLKMQTPDLTEENIKKILEIFPQVRTEMKGENDNVKVGIDFDLLKQELSKDLVEGGEERYRLDWPGKTASILKANTPINKTLRPVKEDSVNFDETQNVYIEGDNFEVLKILQESYLNKVKMIYIDPPYNTGKDFVYTDNFKQTKEEYEEELGVEDEEGGKLFKNTDSNGRFHSDWLSMMCERLKVARDLLKDDGVIFMSIDDNEVHNLRKIADEIFGEENFVEGYIWESTFRPDNSSKIERENAQHILLFSKNKASIPQLYGAGKKTEGLPSLTKNSMNISTLEFPENTVKTFLENDVYKKGVKSSGYELHNDVNVKNGLIVNKFSLSGKMIWSQSYLNEQLANGTVIIIKNRSFVPYSKKKVDGILAPTTIIPKNIVGDVLEGRAEVKNLLEKSIFDFPKPVSLIKYLISTLSVKDEIILDFFSGSATTAHAVMQLNAEDGGNRKFVMVQLPEGIDEKQNKTAYDFVKNELGKEVPTIAEIGKERIRRAGKKILEDYKEELAKRATPLDIGFRVYKTASTNMKDVYYKPDEIKQENLLDLVDNVKEDRTADDLLTQVILDLGLTLDLPMEEREVDGVKVYFVAGNALVACFENDIPESLYKKIAGEKPLKVVFRDSSFKNTEDRINVETIFKQLSPDTTITVI